MKILRNTLVRVINYFFYVAFKDDSNSCQIGKDVVEALNLIKRRLQAELKVSGNLNLRLLAALLNQNDAKVSGDLIKSNRCLNTYIIFAGERGYASFTTKSNRKY